METIASKAFQANYQRLVEPVVVKAKSRTLGTWYPKGTEPEGDTEEVEIGLLLAAKDEEIRHLKRVLAARESPAVAKPASNVRASTKPPAATEIHVGTATYSSRPFTPAPKGK